MPDLPVAPASALTTKNPFTVSEANIQLIGGRRQLKFERTAFARAYTAIKHLQTSPDFDDLILNDITCDLVGSLFYGAFGRTIHTTTVNRILCTNVKPGRPFFMFHGFMGPIVINDLDLVWDPTPNTMTGDIPTGMQVGSHPGDDHGLGEDIESITINRMRVQGINTNWPATSYWNGDGVTIEGTVRHATINNLTVIGVTDGGCDIKCPATIGRMYVESSRAGTKLWDTTTVAHLIVMTPKLQGGIGGKSCLRLQGLKAGSTAQPPTFEFPDVYAHVAPSDPAPLIVIENGPLLFHGVGFYDGPTLVKTGNGGSLLPGSTWNGNAIS